MKASLIRMFQCEVPGIKADFNSITKRAIESGYLIEPEAATNDVLNFLDEQYINPNATFFKQWDDIIYNNQDSLAYEALKHYLSTYGNINPDEREKACLVANGGTVQIDYGISGNGYVPNSDYITIPLNTFKVIKAVTPEFVRDRILYMLNSGIALHKYTLNDCLEFLQQYNFLKNLDVNKIKNKEAQALICSQLGVLPDDEFGMLRCIVWDCTGSTLLIKSKEMIDSLKSAYYIREESINLETLTDGQLKKLSRIFYRYKPIFLALKHRRNRNEAVINKIRRYAKTNHTPLKKGFWETIVCNTPENPSELLSEVKTKIGEINNFKKIQLIQAIRARLLGKNLTSKVYTIRNGKVFVKTGCQNVINIDYLNELYYTIRSSLVESLKKKATTFTVPKSLHLTCPTSEKNFVGNYPTGTWIDFEDSDNVFGIYWRDEWGARDLDLHVVKESGGMIGWNSVYKSLEQDVIFSGDMTSAKPEATELMYFKRQVEDCYISINCYNGYPNCKYRLFVANENIVSKMAKGNSGYRRHEAIMCDPNNIVAEAMLTFNGSGENRIGYIHDNKLHLMTAKSGNERVTDRKFAKVICESNKTMADSFIELIPLLEEAGFERVDATQKTTPNIVSKKEIDVTGLSKEEAIQKVEAAYNEPVAEKLAELDLANIEKDTLIELFA